MKKKIWVILILFVFICIFIFYLLSFDDKSQTNKASKNFDVDSKELFSKYYSKALNLVDKMSLEEKEKLNELVSMFSNAKVPSDVKEMLDYYRVEILLQQIKKDERISHTLQVGAEVFLTPNNDAKLRKYGMTDIQLCILKEREEILPQLDIIENEYQEYYAGIKEFVQKLRKNENRISSI